MPRGIEERKLSISTGVAEREGGKRRGRSKQRRGREEGGERYERDWREEGRRREERKGGREKGRRAERRQKGITLYPASDLLTP